MYQQEAIDTQQCHDKFRDVANASTSMTTAHPFFNCFRSFDEIASFLDRLLLSSRPSNRHLLKVPIASTVQGHPIFGYHWTKPSKGRALLYIQAGIHPREWALDDWDIVFVPVVNVDGYKLTWSAPANRLWRKNARGIDLNRNFGPASYFTATNDTASETSDVPYTSIAGHELYQGALYSGTFKDMVYLSLDRTPSLTIELRGESGFIASSGSIRRSGDELVEAIGAFAAQLH
ncbi:hypothetical protein DYB28_003603 [Aphanomyces astaci]|uniref:Peptidase M14 domain-containing protein n=1 Tax=Aphanomyces astaci TaxID=112090 RepID=A0A9X8H6Q4_APHAT|nr:hypothetical protein DYB28_003603 [Aphanomyces astaci]